MPISLKRMFSCLSALISLFLSNPFNADSSENNKVREITKGTVTGRIMVKEKEDLPLSWGQIMFYDVTSGPPPMPYNYERTPDISKNPGQIIGYYGEGTPSPVPVKEYEIIKGIDFQVVVIRGRGPAPGSAKPKK